MREGLSRLAPALVLIAFGFPLFIGLGSTDLGNDEAIYSYAVESILTTGDWLSPRASPNEHITFLEKPPLKLWLVAAPIGAGLLPGDEFGLRFWDATFGSVAFVYVFLIGRRLAGPFCGLFAVLVLFAHRPLIFDHGFRSNNMDAALVLAYCGGVYHYLRWAASGGARHLAAIAAWFYLGFMTKFVGALFLPVVLGICALLIGSHRHRLLADRRQVALAAAAVAAAVLPWFAYQHLVHGGTFWRVMFGEHVYTRFTAYADPTHVQPWHFYVTAAYRALSEAHSGIWVGLGLLVLVVETIRRRLPDGVVVLVWLVVPIVLISLGSSKLYHYAYPYLPPLALAAGFGAAWLARHLTRVMEPLWTRLRMSAHPVPVSVRVVASASLAVALGLAIWTAAAGTIRLEAGGHLLFRNHSIARPLILAILCGVFAVGPRRGAGAALLLALAWALPGPLQVYSRNLALLAVSDRPLGRLAECLRETDERRRRSGQPAPGVYAPVSEEAFLHPYFFYLRGTGWHGREDDDLLRAALFVEGTQRPVVIDRGRYAGFLERVGDQGPLPVPIEQSRVLILLPAAYAECGVPRRMPSRREA